MRERWARTITWVLVVFYGVGDPVAGYLEAAHGVISRRFDLPPWLVYATCAVQMACVAGILMRRFAFASAVIFTVTTLGAIGAHLRIGSPRTAISAVIFTIMQTWLAWVRRPSWLRRPSSIIDSEGAHES